jgi:pimeloyl-ACP methyl ester carboxylesterase
MLEEHFTLYALDRRGYGDSDDATRYRIEAEYDDIAALAATIENGPVDVVAHSYGALCALGAACRVVPLRRLVIYEPPLPMKSNSYFRPSLITLMREAIARNDNAGAAAAFATQALALTPEEIDAMLKPGARAPLVAHAALVLRELENVERLRGQAGFFRACRLPTLIVLGGDSEPDYRDTAEGLHAVLPSSRITVIEKQRHGAINAAPELYAGEVIRFLTEPGLATQEK